MESTRRRGLSPARSGAGLRFFAHYLVPVYWPLAVAAAPAAAALFSPPRRAGTTRSAPSSRSWWRWPRPCRTCASCSTVRLVPDASKERLIEQILRGTLSDLLIDTLHVMRRKGRLNLVRALARVYREDWLKRKNHVEVRVATAVPLTDELRQELRLTAAERTNRHPILVEKVDPRLLGGIVITIGDHKLNGSVLKEIERFETIVLERAKAELLSGKSYFTEGT